MPRKFIMNNIQNYGIANYSVGFQGVKIRKGAEKDLKRIKFFRQSETLEQALLAREAEIAKKVLEKNYKSTPKDIIPYNCSNGGEPIQLAAKLDMHIRNLEKYIEEHPNDIEAKAQLSKLKDAIKM